MQITRRRFLGFLAGVSSSLLAIRSKTGTSAEITPDGRNTSQQQALKDERILKQEHRFNDHVFFSRFTETARRVIYIASVEPRYFRRRKMEPEHLLLGLLRMDQTLFQRVAPRSSLLADIPPWPGEIKPCRVREEIARRTVPDKDFSFNPDAPSPRDPFSRASLRVLDLAIEESERSSCPNIDTGHILIGLLREEKSLAAEILRNEGLELSIVRRELGCWGH